MGIQGFQLKHLLVFEIFILKTDIFKRENVVFQEIITS